MNVVADAGAVFGWVIPAVDFDALAAAQRHVENERDDMRLGLMGLAASFDGSGDVEVAEAGVAEAVDAVEPFEHMLDQQLGFAIGVGGFEGGVFADGGGFGLAVDGGGGGKDEAVDSRGEHGLKQAEGGGGVVAEIDFWMLHAFAGLDERGEVHDAVDSGAEELFERGAVGEIAFDKLHARGDHGAMGMAEVVVDDDFMALVEEQLGDSSTNIAGAAGHEDFQLRILLTLSILPFRRYGARRSATFARNRG